MGGSVAGPLTSSGNVLENLDAAILATRALIDAGFAPFCPHLTCYVCPANHSADIETDNAAAHGVPMFWTLAELVEHFRAAVAA